MSKQDVYVDGTSYMMSLRKITGLPIVDIVGRVSREFGMDNLVFTISRIVLECGHVLYVEGEHDLAYTMDNHHHNEKVPGMDQESLEAILAEDDDDDEKSWQREQRVLFFGVMRMPEMARVRQWIHAVRESRFNWQEIQEITVMEPGKGQGNGKAWLIETDAFNSFLLFPIDNDTWEDWTIIPKDDDLYE